MTERRNSYGEAGGLTWVDRLGIRMSASRIRKYVSDFRGKRVADLGCGYDALFFRTIDADAGASYLVDVSLAADLRSRANCIEGDLLDGIAQIPDAGIDVVLCISALEHLWKPEDALAAMYRILAPGGICLLNVPTWAGKAALELSAFRLGLSPACEMDDHKMYYGKRDLWPLLVRAGFRPSAIRLRYHKFGLNLFAACRK